MVAYLCSRSPCKAIKAHKIHDIEAKPIPGDNIDSMPVRPYRKSWDFAFDVYWKLEFDRDGGVHGEADDDYYPLGGRIED